MFLKVICAATGVASTFLTFAAAAERDWSEATAWFIVAFNSVIWLLEEFEK